MINLGTYDIDQLPAASTDMPVIRIYFHKKDADEAIIFCKRLVEKNIGFSAH